jgi:adenosylmethionine-8-amino-7-oxononanoate aminotransferase
MAETIKVLVAPIGFFERLRAICNRYGILLIFNEVITGFSRLGAALAMLDLYRDEDLFARARGLEAYWEASVYGLAGYRHVIDIRNLGLVAGIELEPRPGAPGARAMELFRRLLIRGCWSTPRAT